MKSLKRKGYSSYMPQKRKNVPPRGVNLFALPFSLGRLKKIIDRHGYRFVKPWSAEDREISEYFRNPKNKPWVLAKEMRDRKVTFSNISTITQTLLDAGRYDINRNAAARNRHVDHDLQYKFGVLSLENQFILRPELTADLVSEILVISKLEAFKKHTKVHYLMRCDVDEETGKPKLVSDLTDGEIRESLSVIATQFFFAKETKGMDEWDMLISYREWLLTHKCSGIFEYYKIPHLENELEDSVVNSLESGAKAMLEDYFDKAILKDIPDLVSEFKEKAFEIVMSTINQNKDSYRENYEGIKRGVLEDRAKCIENGYEECFGQTPPNKFLNPNLTEASNNLCKRLKDSGFM